ncbi:M16 family metallopeptidase [Pseudomonas cremoricolorata]|uniref:M16 family metallopeptidase n=1 Tax=Pseudomonas cremoricolorata TaxID=157783 RepID=UPI000417C4BC|nr:pitrilysin family protein [Pseudomonas cremoricolorata]
MIHSFLNAGTHCADFAASEDAFDFGGLTSATDLDLSDLPTVQRTPLDWHTAQGSRVRFIESRELAVVDIVLRFTAGSSLDGDLPGLAAATLYMLDQGADDLDAQGLATALEDLGAELRKQLEVDHASLSLRCLSAVDVCAQALQLLTAVVARPRFEVAALEKIRSRLLSHLALSEHNPNRLLQRAVLSELFVDHPYGDYVNGSQAGVSALSVEHLRAFHQRAYSANNLEIAIVGDLSSNQARALAEAISAALPQHWAAAALPPAPAPGATRRELTFPGTGASIALALPLHLTPQHEDYTAVLLGCAVLGSGASSRLMEQLRQRRNLTYDIRVTPTLWKAGGLLTVRWEIAAHYAEASRQLVLATIACFVEHGPTHAELERAANQHAGALLLEAARNDQAAALLAQHSQHGLPARYLTDFIEQLRRVTPEQVRQALQRWIDVRGISFFSIGPRQPQQHLPDWPEA